MNTEQKNIHETLNDSLVDIYKKLGEVATDIHPDHLEKIRELHLDCERLKVSADEAERKFTLAKKRVGLAKLEMWDAIHDSFDTVQKALEQECHGHTIEMGENIIMFKNRQKMDAGNSNVHPLMTAILGSSGGR